MTLPKGFSPRNHEDDDKYHSSNDKDKDDDHNVTVETEPYTFNGKVVIGIGLIIAVAAISTIFVMTISKSPQIQLSLDNIISGSGSSTTVALGEQQQQDQSQREQKVDRRFILIQNDFGWNGTNLGPTIKVTKGNVVQLTIINAGGMAHNFGIAKFSDSTKRLLNESMATPSPERIDHVPYSAMSVKPCPDCEPKFEQAHIDFFMKPLTQQEITFTANEAGEFKYFCMVRGHLWLGMFGDLIVEEV